MTDTEVQAEQTAPTRDNLFPEGWDRPKPEKAQPDMFEEESEDESEILAESQDQEQDEEETSPEAGAVSMPINRFIKSAGWELNDAYHNLTLTDEDGTVNSLSKVVDERRELKHANDALLRERQELQEKLNQSATNVPQPGISPEAQALMSQAELYQKALQTTDWSQLDPAQAANQKFDLQLEITRLQQEAQQKQVAYHGELQEKIAKARSEADRQTRARIPEWSDAQVMASDKRAIADMMGGYGMGQQEIDTIVDPRVWRMLLDAQRAMVNGKRIAEGAKKVRKVSKTTLSGGSRTTEPKKKLTPEQMRKQVKEAKTQGGREGAQRARLSLEFE